MAEHPLLVAADMAGHVLVHQALDLIIGIQPSNLLLKKDDPFFKGTHKIASVNFSKHLSCITDINFFLHAIMSFNSLHYNPPRD
jgi:hypothetical protein